MKNNITFSKSLALVFITFLYIFLFSTSRQAQSLEIKDQTNRVKTTITKKVEESAWGETLVKETPSTRREWVITGSNPEPYLWDDESTITAVELTKAMADRETYLATIKQRRDEYKASQNTAPAIASIPTGSFQF